MNYFDLEEPQSLARLTEPATTLRPLKGMVVIDEIQRRPDLFPLLRVLADRSSDSRTIPHSRKRFTRLATTILREARRQDRDGSPRGI